MSYPGERIGIRPPAANETPLSWSEVEVAVSIGLVIDVMAEVDTFPTRRIIRKAGTWKCNVESRGMWSGLMQ